MDIEDQIIDNTVKFETGKKILEKLTLTVIDNNLEYNRNQLEQIKNEYSKGKGFILTKAELTKIYNKLLKTTQIGFNINVKNTITKRIGKSHSGIVSITIVTKPGGFSCKFNCFFCPSEPNTPRSYVSTGPSVLRAIRNEYDTILQFRDRFIALSTIGHEVNKVELILIGGTFSSHTLQYQEQLFTELYYAANTIYDNLPLRLILTLEEELKINETSKCRLIGITIETRGDMITHEEIIRLRKYGVTRVQLGIQHLDDNILEKVNRQCPTKKTIEGIKLLKANGFKIDGHFMPDLPGSSYESDLSMFKYLFSENNVDIQCDQLKIYPFMVTKWTQIEKWFLDGKYKSYGDEDECKLLFELLVYIAINCPIYIRLNRVVRDIPGNVIYNKIGKHTNMYQDILEYLKQHNLKGMDIRAREIKLDSINLLDCAYFTTKYKSSDGIEYFISCETKDRSKLIGFLRLRINNYNICDKYIVFDDLYDCALIRELHVYGKLTNIGIFKTHYQHAGVGKTLLMYAENIASLNGCMKMAVIAGVGARKYYEKYGYRLFGKGGYMFKFV